MKSALLSEAGRRTCLGRAAAGRLAGPHPLGLPVGPGRQIPASLLLLLLQPLLLLLQVSGHVVEGGLVETAEAVVRTRGACAGGTRTHASWTVTWDAASGGPAGPPRPPLQQGSDPVTTWSSLWTGGTFFKVATLAGPWTRL